MHNRFFAAVDRLYSEYVKVWADVCNIESPTAYKAGVDAVGNYFADMARKRGFEVEFFNHPVSGNVVCITANPTAKGEMLCLSGHVDTVHPIGLFGNPAVKIEDGKIYGPGVLDCKGGVVAAFLAMDALYSCGFCDRPVRLLIQSDEEGGSMYSNKSTVGYMCEMAKGSAAFLNLEGHTEGKICLQRKGIITYAFKITGIEAHSSACATSGANAIAEAAHKIIELEKLKDAKGLTCNCGVISGGSVPNTVAGYCEFNANIRFANAEQLEWVKEYAAKVAAETHVEGCTCALEQISFRVAMPLEERNVRLSQRLNAVFDKAGLPVLEAMAGLGGSDAADVTVFGVPCVDNLGVEGGRIHSPDEYAILESLRKSAKRMVAAALYI